MLLVVVVILLGCSDGGSKRLGDVCTKNDECASGRCDEQVCKARNPGGPGEPCQRSLDCRSERCMIDDSGRWCGQGQRQDGQVCTDDLQCVSGRCLAGLCSASSSDGALPDAGTDAKEPDGPAPDLQGVDAGGQDIGTAATWSRTFGGAWKDYGRSVAVDSAGNIYLAGDYHYTVNFGGTKSLKSMQDSQDIFVASFDSTGAHRWSQSSGGPGDDFVGFSGMVLGTNGDVVLAGRLEFAGNDDAFVASYASTSGALNWSKSLGSTGQDQAWDIAVDNSGDIYVIGFFEHGVDFGGGTLTSAGALDIFVASYTAAGAYSWAERYGDYGNDYGYSLTVSPTGAVVMIGSFWDHVDFGGGAEQSAGDFDAFLAGYTPSGAYDWSTRYGGASEENPYAIAQDASGNLYLTGRFAGVSNLGGKTLNCQGNHDAFIASYTAAGVHRWSRGFGSTGEDTGNGLAVDAEGNVYLLGFFQDSVDPGGGLLTSAGSYDVFVASYTSDGEHRWSKRYGGTGEDYSWGGIVVDTSGSVYVTGTFSATVDFGSGAVSSAGNGDIFLLKLPQ